MHGRADARLAPEFKLAAVQFQQAFRQRQAEAGAIVWACERAVRLAEQGHDLRDVLVANSDPGIRDRKGYTAARFDRGGKSNFAVFRGELDRVGEDVEQYLLDPQLVSEEGGHLVGQVHVETDLGLVGAAQH